MASTSIFGFSGKDVNRIGMAVRDYESRPPDLPIADGKHVRTHARVLIFEVVSGPVDGVYQVLILQRTPAGAYEPVSTIEAIVEDINAV